MTWHVIRLAPNALRPDNGNRFRTIVERSLAEGGFSSFLPFEERPIVHFRTKKKIWRRFPMMPGYGFVEDVSNFEALRQCDGVGDVIKSAGRPVPIDEGEVRRVMLAEMGVNAEHDRLDAVREAREAMGTREAVLGAFPVGTLVVIKEGHLLAGETFVVGTATGRATVKGVVDRLNGMSVEIDAVNLEAADWMLTG